MPHERISISNVAGKRSEVIRLAALLLLIPTLALAAEPEAYYQARLCQDLGTEVELQNGGRVDCVSDIYAIEIDFTEKWAEALGQSLLYAASLDKLPGIMLICRQSARLCLGHALRLDEAIAYWELPVKVWRYDQGEFR